MEPATLVLVSDSQELSTEPKLSTILDAHPKNGSSIKLSRIQWGKLTLEQKRKAVKEHPKHVRYWEATGRELDFIPRLQNWLRDERFEDEIEEVSQPRSEPWWRSNEGIAAEFKRRGKEIPPGKSWEECRAMLMSAT